MPTTNLLTLIKAQVWKYKSIEDSTPVDIAEEVTVLVGKNESGKTAFLEAAKVAVKANRDRVDQDDANGVKELRAQGMTVIEDVDKAKFVAQLAPVNAEFEKQFGKANLDKIRNYK